MGGVVLTFLGLVALAAPKADPANLLRADFSAVVSAVPVMFVVRALWGLVEGVVCGVGAGSVEFGHVGGAC